jgi:hypothetical protein
MRCCPLKLTKIVEKFPEAGGSERTKNQALQDTASMGSVGRRFRLGGLVPAYTLTYEVASTKSLKTSLGLSFIFQLQWMKKSYSWVYI